MHNPLARKIIVDGVGDSELYFGIGGRWLRFSKYEFCLLIGLKFGGRTHFSAYNNNIVEGGVSRPNLERLTRGNRHVPLSGS